MTSTDDVIRQVEAALNDTHYPPTPKQKEILTTILRKVNTQTSECGRANKNVQDCIISLL